MSLPPAALPEVPADKARVAHKAFRKGHPWLLLRQELPALYDDTAFADLYSERTHERELDGVAGASSPTDDSHQVFAHGLRRVPAARAMYAMQRAAAQSDDLAASALQRARQRVTAINLVRLLNWLRGAPRARTRRSRL